MRRILFAVVALLFLLQSVYATSLIDSVKPFADTSIAQYRKFEVCVQLSSAVQQDTPYRYNYDFIWTYAVFKGPNGEMDTADGFWYQLFSRCDTCYNPTEFQHPWDPNDTDTFRCGSFNQNAVDSEDGPRAYLTRLSNSYPWHMRFATGITGQWHYKIHLKTLFNTDSSGEYTFTVTSGTDKGFVKVAPNGRNFCYADGSVFIPLGVNTYVANGADTIYNRTAFKINTLSFPYFNKNGCNLVRLSMSPQSLGIEWGPRKPGDYDNRQDRAFDMDGIMDSADYYNIYIQASLGVRSELIPDPGSYAIGNWLHNPYNIVNGGYVDSAIQFFQDSNCIRYYNNRLRYILARWGYSPHFFSVEPYTELDRCTDGGFWVTSNRNIMIQWVRNYIRYGKKLNKHIMFNSGCTWNLTGIMPA